MVLGRWFNPTGFSKRKQKNGYVIIPSNVSTLRVLVNAPYLDFLLTYQSYGFGKLILKIYKTHY